MAVQAYLPERLTQHSSSSCKVPAREIHSKTIAHLASE